MKCMSSVVNRVQRVGPQPVYLLRKNKDTKVGENTVDFSTISTTWALLEKTAKILILTESERLPLATKIRTDNLGNVSEVKIMNISIDHTYEQEMLGLTAEDLLIILLTVDGFIQKGYRSKFSPFTR